MQVPAVYYLVRKRGLEASSRDEFAEAVIYTDTPLFFQLTRYTDKAVRRKNEESIWQQG